MNNTKPALDEATPKTLAEKAKVSPTSIFDKPTEVVENDKLTNEEKQDVLKQWEADAQALQTATDEGMSGGRRPGLEEVKHAQGELNKAKRN